MAEEQIINDDQQTGATQKCELRVRRIHRRDLNRVWEFLKVVFRDVNRETVEYLGSGIYFGRFHSSLRHWVHGMPDALPHRRRAFLFSTAGLSFLWRVWHWPLKAQLMKKGFEIAAEFHCRGFDTFGPLWLIGGINHRRPNERDLEDAANFARNDLVPSPRG